MRNQKGITLIALVITIIVLLILAGVSIAMLTGQNGILTQANNSKTETTKAEAIERINLALNAVKSEIYNQQVTNSTYNAAPTATSAEAAIITMLAKDGITATTAPGDATYGYWYTITGSVLTIHYKNVPAGVSTEITGSIQLTPNYTINKAPIS